jgi:hypothetical protein
MYSIGAKGSTKTNKTIKLGFKRKEQKTEGYLGLAHRTVSGAPWTVHSELLSFGFLECHSAIIHWTVRSSTGLSGMPAEQRLASATVVCKSVNSAHRSQSRRQGRTG